MRVLSTTEICYVSGGISSKVVLSFRGGVLGGTEGAVIGCILSVPLWNIAVTYGGSSLAIACVAVGVGAGSLLGGVLGLCTGYTIYCWSEPYFL